MRYQRLLVIGLFISGTWLALAAAGAGDDAAAVIEVGSSKQLFIDDRFIESSRDVELVMNPPRRDGKVLLTTDQPWEAGRHVSVYSSVIRENGLTKVWYDFREPTQGGPDTYKFRVCYAESESGLQFIKPQLDLFEVDGSTANSVVMPGAIGGCSVWIDPQAPPEHRYKNQAKVYPSGKLHMHSSPDGLHWKLFAQIDPGPGGYDTQTIVFWDASCGRYVMYTRRWVKPESKAAWHRTVRRRESDDLLHWKNESVSIEADDIDLATHTTHTGQPPVDYYGANVFRYAEAQDVYIMLAQPYWHWHRRDAGGLGPSTFDVRLAVSRDGKQFQRAGNRKPFMPTGPDGRFDSRFVWAMPQPIRMGNELWIYYVGMNRDHDQVLDPAAPGGNLLAGIGRAVLRLDGFISADADYSGGEITTPALRFSGTRLELNVETSGGGSVAVEILDENHDPIPGFGREDAAEVHGNSVALPIGWRGTQDVSPLAGRVVHLRFHMQDCKLYAFQFR